MIPKPPHNRKLGLSGVALTKARNNRFDAKALTEVRDEIEKVMVESGYLEEAPFSWVTIAVRYGLKDDSEPEFQKINKEYGDLPLSIEVDTNKLTGASLEELKGIFRLSVLKALISAGIKYQRPIEKLEALQRL